MITSEIITPGRYKMMPHNFIDITGKKFGRLTVLELVTTKPRSKWRCICECGIKRDVCGSQLRSGHSKSCGCLKDDTAKGRNKTHGMRFEKIYTIWNSMIQRCANKKNDNYGGKGITVCSDWLNFEGFYEFAKANNYKDGLSIERIDNSKGYNANNCIFIPKEHQNKNKSNTKILDKDVPYILKVYTETKRTLVDISKEFNCHPTRISQILKANGINVRRSNQYGEWRAK